MRATRFLIICALIVVSTAKTWPASPCSGIKHDLSSKQKAALAPLIAKQMGHDKVDVLRSLQYGEWRILYVVTNVSDDQYVFYSHHPAKSRYITTWGGVATSDEEKAIKNWTIQNAPGIPERLAACFAWNVTNNPN